LKKQCDDLLPLNEFISEDISIEKINPRKESVLILAEVSELIPEKFILSKEESSRADRFLKAETKLAFFYQHHLLREFLSVWMNASAIEITFNKNPFDKPELPDTPFYFNISRSENYLAFYFGPNECGIDIEKRRLSENFSEISNQHFHPEEQEFIQSDDDFFSVWTRKEAVLKAIGTGLQSQLNHINTLPSLVKIGTHDYQLQSFKTENCIISLSTLEGTAQKLYCISL